MTQLKAHEMLDIQEHIRSSGASAHALRSMAQRVQDPEVRRICEAEEQSASSTVQRLMGFLTGNR